MTIGLDGPISDREAKLMVLRAYSGVARDHIQNMIGRSFQRGNIESAFGRAFTSEERSRFGRVTRDLVRQGLLTPTYDQVTDAEDWLAITNTGRLAAERADLDELDSALHDISVNLRDMRSGAQEALHSGGSDALRQAAHSGRELISQILRTLSPDEEIKCQPWFAPVASSNSGVTRRHRIKYALQQRKDRFSESEMQVAEKQAELVDVLYSRLSSAAHSAEPPHQRDVGDMLQVVDMFLRKLLLGNY